jgi:hypothetical protein
MRRYSDSYIDNQSDFTTIFSEESDCFYPHLLGLLDGAYTVERMATCRQDQKYITYISKPFQLARENGFKRIVITDGSNSRSVSCKGNGW